MTPRQIELIQDTFAAVRPNDEAAADLFYSRLFEIAPEVRPMFRGDLKEQGRKLMATLAFVVAGLSRFDKLKAAVSKLGSRHASYGVQDQHYAAVAEALLWTLRQGLGASFTSEAEEAWTVAYTMLAGTMRDGSAVAVAVPAA
jgi:nitric oxide dioxygenase